MQVAVAKVNKYASSESGDTVEIIERPRGGLSAVMADGQRSGRSAKVISNIVVRKAISLLAEGVRDGAAARATHDYLQVHRSGKVSAELNIVSVDLDTKSLVISRNSHCPVIVRRVAQTTTLDDSSSAIGIYSKTKPAITEFALEADTTIVAFTDGVFDAGARSGTLIQIPQLLEAIDGENSTSAVNIADSVLAEAMRLEDDRPRDDATVLVVKVCSFLKQGTHQDKIRRMSMRFPL
ncbi:MAG: PP2C family protein-serine/threonine phosphatase [Chloroflexota bacterium]